MYAFKDNLASTSTHQILLSPQKEADQYPPEIGLRNKIRIPVYQQRTVDLTPYIYEDSGIANIRDVEIDFDLNTDSDGDGFANNDVDTENINILRTPTTIKVQFGPYDTLFTRKIRIRLTDRNYNTGYQDVDFEVYTPDPQIQNYEEGILYGEINETLLDEPVRIYRVRGGTIKKLQESDGNDIVQTDTGGSYQFGVAETASGLLVKQNNLDVARVNEYTGVITLLNPAARIEVLAANDIENETGFPRMSVKIGEDELFYQYLQTANVPDIQLLADSYSMASGEGIGVNLIDQERFGLYKVPFGVAYNPGAVIVYDNTDSEKKELFSVFRDGRIYVSSDRWNIRYKSFGESAGYEIVDTTTDIIVMQVVIKLEASYILR